MSQAVDQLFAQLHAAHGSKQQHLEGIILCPLPLMVAAAEALIIDDAGASAPPPPPPAPKPSSRTAPSPTSPLPPTTLNPCLPERLAITADRLAALGQKNPPDQSRMAALSKLLADPKVSPAPLKLLSDVAQALAAHWSRMGGALPQEGVGGNRLSWGGAAPDRPLLPPYSRLELSQAVAEAAGGGEGGSPAAPAAAPAVPQQPSSSYAPPPPPPAAAPPPPPPPPPPPNAHPSLPPFPPQLPLPPYSYIPPLPSREALTSLSGVPSSLPPVFPPPYPPHQYPMMSGMFPIPPMPPLPPMPAGPIPWGKARPAEHASHPPPPPAPWWGVWPSLPSPSPSAPPPPPPAAATAAAAAHPSSLRFLPALLQQLASPSSPQPPPPTSPLAYLTACSRPLVLAVLEAALVGGEEPTPGGAGAAISLGPGLEIFESRLHSIGQSLPLSPFRCAVLETQLAARHPEAMAAATHAALRAAAASLSGALLEGGWGAGGEVGGKRVGGNILRGEEGPVLLEMPSAPLSALHTDLERFLISESDVAPPPLFPAPRPMPPPQGVLEARPPPGVETWGGAGGMEALLGRAAAAPYRHLVADKLGALIGPEVHFGVVSTAAQNEEAGPGQAGGAGGGGGGGGGPAAPPPPPAPHPLASVSQPTALSYLLKGTGDVVHWVEDLRAGNVLFREVSVRNTSSDPVRILHVSLHPGPTWRSRFALLDDFGLAADWAPARGPPPSAPSWDPSPPTPPSKSVLLAPGETYAVTVAVRVGVGAGHTIGVVSQNLLLVLHSEPNKSKSKPQLKPASDDTIIPPPSPPGAPFPPQHPWEETCTETLPGGGIVAVVSRKVSAVFTPGKTSDANRAFNTEARPFVPQKVRETFNSEPEYYFRAEPSESVRQLLQGPPQFPPHPPSPPGRAPTNLPACADSSVFDLPHARAVLGAENKYGNARAGGGVWGGHGAGSQADGLDLPPNPWGRWCSYLLRLLRLEERVLQKDGAVYDMWGVRAQWAVGEVWREGEQAQATVRIFPTPPGRQPETERWLGPDLRVAVSHDASPYPRAGPGKKQKYTVFLLAVEVPGLPENRPKLFLADRVHVRFADVPLSDKVEFSGSVVHTRGATAFVEMPPLFWVTLVTLMKKGPPSEFDPVYLSPAGHKVVVKSALRDKRPLNGPLKPPPSLCDLLVVGGAEEMQLQAPRSQDMENCLITAKHDAAPRIHVRLAPDRWPYVRMGQATVRAAQASLPMLPMGGGAPTPEEGPLPWTYPLPPPDREAGFVHHFQNFKQVSGLSPSSRVDLNLEQRAFVAACLARTSGPLPLILFGPPGTGKTVTLVETALQVLRAEPGARILMCAPSGISPLPADLLCSGLEAAGLPPGEVIRINDPRSPPANTRREVLRYCLMGPGGLFRRPTWEDVGGARVIVVSCAAAALLSELGPSPPPFTHVFIDEAGQAIIPETLIALNLLAPMGQAVLCGDPKQLGPTLRCAAAAARGLATPALESCIRRAEWVLRRLSDTPGAPLWRPFGLGPFLPYFIMLRQNYRSNRALLDLPSKMFYSDALVAAADQATLNPPYVSDAWRDLGIPGLPPGACTAFLGVLGKQSREGDAPSYINSLEASVVAELVSKLIAAQSAAPGDLGVITTYRRQAFAIRQLLRERGLGAVRCGTVDDYQGQEERIIIISTVLSRPESLPHGGPVAGGSGAAGGGAGGAGSDPGAHVGFWRNAKRFNVAITRARVMMVVVGHPVVLWDDASWRHLLKYCAARGTWFGSGREVMEQFGAPMGPGGRRRGAQPQTSALQMERAFSYGGAAVSDLPAEEGFGRGGQRYEPGGFAPSIAQASAAGGFGFGTFDTGAKLNGPNGNGQPFNDGDGDVNGAGGAEPDYEYDDVSGDPELERVVGTVVGDLVLGSGGWETMYPDPDTAYQPDDFEFRMPL